MKRMLAIGLTAVLLGLAGCGSAEDGHNRNLKPLDPNATPPKMQSGDGAGGAAKGAADSPTVIR